MNKRQRQGLADKLMDVGNLAVGALLLGQFLAKEFNWLWTVAGFGAWVVLFRALARNNLCLYGVGYLLLRGEDEER